MAVEDSLFLFQKGQPQTIPTCSNLTKRIIARYVEITCIAIMVLALILFEAALPTQLPFFLSCTCYMHYCVVKYWKCFRVDGKKLSKTDDNSTISVFALNYAFGDYIPYRLAARFS